MTAAPAELLRVEDVSKAFGAVKAVSQVSLELNPGDILGVIGPNGSGKSTLINTLSGVLRADSGRVLLKEVDVSGWSIQRRARVGLVRTFQNLRLNESMTVRDNLSAGLLRRSSLGRGEGERLVMNFLEEINLLGEARVLAGELGLGQRRRLELGRALISDPSVVLLDEPAAGMDASERTSFVSTIRRHVTRLGGAVLVVEHDMGLLRELCPQSVVMHTGTVIFRGSTEAALEDDRVIASYLGGSGGA